MGITCKVHASSVVGFVTVRDWKMFCELSVRTGHYVTHGYLETKVTIKQCRIHLNLFIHPEKGVRTFLRNVGISHRYMMLIRKRTSLFDQQPPQEHEHIEVFIEVRIMSLIHIAQKLEFSSLCSGGLCIAFRSFTCQQSVDFALISALHIRIDVVNQFMSLPTFYRRS